MAGRVIITAAGLTDPGKCREHNEDAFIISDLARPGGRAGSSGPAELEADQHPILLGVSDGMGGAAAGEVASALVIDSIDGALVGKRGDWKAATTAAVERANRTVWQASQQEGHAGMGATLTAVCID